MYKSIFIKLPTEFEYEEALSEVDRLISGHETSITIKKGFEYVRVKGEMAMDRFYSDMEGGVTACYGLNYIHYGISIKDFLNRLKENIELI